MTEGHRQVLDSIARKEAWSRERAQHVNSHEQIDDTVAAEIAARHNPRPDAPDLAERLGPGDGGARADQRMPDPAGDGLDQLRREIAQAERGGDWTTAMKLKDELSLGLGAYAEQQRRGPYA
jgi:hypothetical protein